MLTLQLGYLFGSNAVHAVACGMHVHPFRLAKNKYAAGIMQSAVHQAQHAERREFLEEVSRPDRERIGCVPVKPCLRSLRPLLVSLRRLLTEARS